MDEQPQFRGVYTLLQLVKHLAERPRYRFRSAENERNGDTVLPLICVERRVPRNLLKRLELTLTQGSSQRVPHAFVDAAALSHDKSGPGGEPVVALLHEVVQGLSRDQFGPWQRLRFSHYGLVDLLTRLQISRDEQDVDGFILDELRRHKRGSRGRGSRLMSLTVDLLDRVVGGIFSIVPLLAHIPAKSLMTGWGRQKRWLMRHQMFSGPKHSTSFTGFAARLVPSQINDNDPRQIRLLLVHAFLQDLRVAFSRARWRLILRRKGFRRTAYALLLLDNITADNGGWDLLSLINDVRNETGDLDPLLVVATTGYHAAQSIQPNPPDVAEAFEALENWRSVLPSKRQRLTGDARYLILRAPEPEPVEDLPERDRGAWSTVEIWRPPPPSWARKGVAEAAVTLLVFAGILPVLVTAVDLRNAGCGAPAVWHRSVGSGVDVTSFVIDGKAECVGYSDSAALLFGSGDQLRKAQERAFAQNRVAASIATNNPNRVVASIVYFAGLTHGLRQSETDDATAEEIDGLVLRQQEQNTESTSGPLLRVIIANGGARMAAAPFVAQRYLSRLLDSDPSIVAVVGMDRTVTETEQAIELLGSNGVLVMGTTLTGTGLKDRSPLYFGLVPDNERLVELVTLYAARIVKVRKITVYAPADAHGDTYVITLVEALRRTTRITVDLQPWQRTPTELTSICADSTDRSNEMIFFAGRETDFADFLRTVTKGCLGQPLPHIVAADTIHRFMADADQRAQLQVSGVRVAYIGLASMVVLAGKQCLEGKPNPILYGGPTLETFCQNYKGLIAGSHTPALWPAELVGLSYDAAGLIIEAVRVAAGPRSTAHRGAVAQALRELKFPGVTGTYNFATARVANTRNVAILNVDNIGDQAAPPTCAFLIGDPPYPGQAIDSQTGCPRSASPSPAL